MRGRHRLPALVPPAAAARQIWQPLAGASARLLYARAAAQGQVPHRTIIKSVFREHTCASSVRPCLFGVRETGATMHCSILAVQGTTHPQQVSLRTRDTHCCHGH